MAKKALGMCLVVCACDVILSRLSVDQMGGQSESAGKRV
jgi:hypothetical protein